MRFNWDALSATLYLRRIIWDAVTVSRHPSLISREPHHGRHHSLQDPYGAAHRRLLRRADEQAAARRQSQVPGEDPGATAGRARGGHAGVLLRDRVPAGLR